MAAARTIAANLATTKFEFEYGDVNSMVAVLERDIPLFLYPFSPFLRVREAWCQACFTSIRKNLKISFQALGWHKTAQNPTVPFEVGAPP